MVRKTGVQSQVESYQRLKKKVLDAAFYKVRIKGKVEQSREGSRALTYTLGVVAIEKRAFGSPLTKGDNFTYLKLFHLLLLTINKSNRNKMKKILVRNNNNKTITSISTITCAAIIR